MIPARLRLLLLAWLAALRRRLLRLLLLVWLAALRRRLLRLLLLVWLAALRRRRLLCWRVTPFRWRLPVRLVARLLVARRPPLHLAGGHARLSAMLRWRWRWLALLQRTALFLALLSIAPCSSPCVAKRLGC